MSNKKPGLASRHPKIVMIHENSEDVLGAVKILTSHFKDFCNLAYNKATTKYLLTNKPTVLLFAFSSIEKSVEYYSYLLDEAQLTYPHFSILLCKNKEAGVAFRCCIKGLFENYFVYQPLYEKFRLIMIVHSALNLFNKDEEAVQLSESAFDEVDNELSALIDQSGELKKGLLSSIQDSYSGIVKATESYQGPNDFSTAQTKELVDAITEQHIKPLLSLLESDINAGLDGLLAQLLSQKNNIKEKAQEAKGLIHHQASIKSKAEKMNDLIEKTAKENQEKEKTNPGMFDTLDFDDEVDEHEDQAKEILDDLNQVSKKNEDYRILIVEDNAIYREMLNTVLKHENFITEEAEDGLVALRYIKEKRYDLIIMDLFMPKLDGLNTTKKIRSISGGRDIPIIALTGNKNKELVKKWAAYGLKGYIMKPSTKEQIINTVQRVISTENEPLDQT